MDITKQITVIDKDKIKVGDILRITRKDIYFENVILVIEVTNEHIVAKFDNGIKCNMGVKELVDYVFEKVDIKTSKFATGQLYRVEDANSCDKFDILITTVSNSEISAIKLKSASAISIKESEIDSRYKFTKIKTVEDVSMPQSECEDKDIAKSNHLDKVFETVLKGLECQRKDNRPFFTEYKPSIYFRNDTK